MAAHSAKSPPNVTPFPSSTLVTHSLLLALHTCSDWCVSDPAMEMLKTVLAAVSVDVVSTVVSVLEYLTLSSGLFCVNNYDL